jgi:spermidine synthase
LFAGSDLDPMRESLPVLGVLAYDLIIFLLAAVSTEHSFEPRTLLVSVLFFFSGMPALVYQIVWQRSLFAIYGVNAESVAVVVSAFMLGLGLGSLVGGWLSSRFPQQALLLFGLSELGIAVFGICSLRIFRWAAVYSAGANLLLTIFFSLLLLTIPTLLMGTTLPLLSEHVVRTSSRVGYSVATIYFANTFGSAVACYFCATFLLRDFWQSGAVLIAACLNIVVGTMAAFLGSRKQSQIPDAARALVPKPQDEVNLPLGLAMLIGGLSGFVALAFEIVWFRVFVLASSDRAPAFALLLSTYLAGIAAGAFIGGKLTVGKSSAKILRAVGFVMLVAGAVSPYLPPLVAVLKLKDIPFLLSSIAFFVTSALIGSVFPLMCNVAISADLKAGRGVSFVYVSNIIGSTLGGLIVGFVLMDHFGLRQISGGLGFTAIIVGGIELLLSYRKLRVSAWVVVVIIGAFIMVPVASRFYSFFFEKLIFGSYADAIKPFARIAENRNGVIAVTPEGAVYGNGVYDGYFNIDPKNVANGIVRAYAISAFCPAPKRILEIGLSSGSWAQVLANLPGVESLDIIEINPGYLQLIAQYPMVRSILSNPKVHIHIDDGRRWLLAHPRQRYDVIVQNTSFYWRDHSSDLLSTDYLEIVRYHLDSGGIYYYNTTWSDDVVATGLDVFPYGLRLNSFLAVSDSPIELNKDRWLSILRQFRIDNELIFPPDDPKSEKMLGSYLFLADSVNQPQIKNGFENSSSLRSRLKNRLIITDDNMGWEWRAP